MFSFCHICHHSFFFYFYFFRRATLLLCMYLLYRMQEEQKKKDAQWQEQIEYSILSNLRLLIVLVDFWSYIF